MGVQQEQITKAIEDLSIIRRAVDPRQKIKQNAIRSQAYLFLQGLMFAISALFAAIEVITDGQMTSFLRAADREAEFFWYSVAFMGVLLAMMSGAGAMIIARSAKLNDEGFSYYLDRHFQSFRNMSVYYDLVLKLVVLSLLLAAGKAAWVGPTLFLFTGDYLFQRRLTQLSDRTTISLGLASAVCGALSFFLHLDQLVWPLLWFSAIAGFSFALILLQQGKRNETT